MQSTTTNKTACLLLLALVSSSARAADAPLFEKDVRPILKAHCFHCHGEAGETKGKLDLRLRRFIVKGGESGAAIEAGKPDESYLLSRLVAGEMPPGDKNLSDSDIDTIRRWIASGAETARPEPETISNGDYFSEEERNYWAFRPVVRPAIPRVRHNEQVFTPVDAFLLHRLEASQQTMSAPAEAAILVRRVTQDLLGLPPTPEEVQAFVNDQRPDAWQRLVNRLLSSPLYGERWGRHWLDTAGYADSEGYSDDDKVRPSAFRYRDYVISSFNADLAFDRFIIQQLAGDELVAPPGKVLTDEQIEALAATGFLRMAPDGTGSGGVNAVVARNEVVADTIRIVSTSLLGLTVGCARCHDHRYDPISQADYYRMRAIFEPALNPKQWRSPSQRKLSLYTEADRAEKKRIEADAAVVDKQRTEKTEFYITRTLEEELLLVPATIRKTLRTAYRESSSKRTDEQKALLKKYPSVANISAGSLYLYDRRRERRAGKLDAERKRKEQEFLARARKAHPGKQVTLDNLSEFDAAAAKELKSDRELAARLRNEKAADDLKSFSARAQEIRDRIPEEGFLRALTEVPGQVPTTFVFFRGDHQQPKQAVKPGELSVLDAGATPGLPVNDASLPTTGRRLAYARHLVSGRHPLVARVIVNRIWMHHFGRGLVSSPGDFGVLGERPTHPQLLDWLADEFVRSGWQVKQLHRLLLDSWAYRQSSRRRAPLDEMDPDNLLLGRMSIRRLESESLRDAILAVSGALNSTMYGKPVPVMEDAVGQIVLGQENLDGERKPTNRIDLGGDLFRRSLYVQVRRTRPLGVLEAFDVPVMTPNCSKRNASNVAPQSLMLMNSDFMVEYSGRMADRVMTDAGPDRRSQVMRAWSLAFGVEPEADVVEQLAGFLVKQEKAFTDSHDKTKDKTTSDAQRALASLCQAILSANRFLYID